jgi:hypothetical protein
VTRGGHSLGGVQKSSPNPALQFVALFGPTKISGGPTFFPNRAQKRSEYDHARPNQVKSTEINEFTDWPIQQFMQFQPPVEDVILVQ